MLRRLLLLQQRAALFFNSPTLLLWAYINPQIKIISQRGQRRIIQGKNNAPMPRMDLYERLRS